MRMKYLKSTKSTRCRFVIVHESNYLKSIIIPIDVMRVKKKKKKKKRRRYNENCKSHDIIYTTKVINYNPFVSLC